VQVQSVVLRLGLVGTAGNGATFARGAFNGAGECHCSTRRQRPVLGDPDALACGRLLDPRVCAATLLPCYQLLCHSATLLL